jgi:hypothetical protein
MAVKFVLDYDSIREVVEAEAGDELTEVGIHEAVEEILSLAGDICLFSLAQHVVDEVGVDLASYVLED